MVAGILIARYLRNRRSAGAIAPSEQSSPADVPSPDVVDTRAEELRRRLDEARTAVKDDEDFVAPGMAAEVVAEEDPPADEFEAMRRRVHAEARHAANKMRS